MEKMIFPLWTTLFFLFFISKIALSQDCPAGNLTIQDQSELNNFISDYPNCTEINGNIDIYGDITNLNGLRKIKNISGGVEITSPVLENLEGLEALETIGGDIVIEGNANLSSLVGLNSLTQIDGAFVIRFLPNLIDLTGIESLTSIGEMIISTNPNFQSLQGLEALTNAGNFAVASCENFSDLSPLTTLNMVDGTLSITDNDNLFSLAGLENINAIGGALVIERNDALNDISSLSNITSIGALRIRNNNILIDLSGLDNLSAINGLVFINSNPNLSSLTGFEQLQSIDNELWIYDNASLSDLSALDSLMFVAETIHIYDNPFLSNCSVYGVCNHIENGGNTDIRDNSNNCNSTEQVEFQCGLTLQEDADGDGYIASEDCDDNNAEINPEAEEIPNNDIDEDCDGTDLIVSSLDDPTLSNIHIFPNPTRDILQINLPTTIEGIITLKDYSGKSILTMQIMAENQLDLSKLSHGLYLLEIHSADGIWIKKVFKND